MSDPKEPYDVEPGQPAGDKPAPQPSESGAPAKPRLFDVPPPAPNTPKGKIQAPELLSGFAEDADFDKDPEVDKVILGTAPKPDKVPEPEVPKEDFVQPGLGGPKVWAIVGVVLLVAALIATGVQTAPNAQQRLLRVILLLYSTLLHTGTGVVALFVAATLLRKHLGSFELAASRMFTAVGAFALMMSLQMKLFGVQWLDRTVVLLFAAAAYTLIVATTFNLWKKHPLLYVIGSHFFLWLIVAVGMLLAQAAQPSTESPTSAAKPATPASKPGAPPATGKP